MNLKGNLELVLDELANANEEKPINARQLKEKIYQYTISDLQKSGQCKKKCNTDNNQSMT